MNLLVDLLKMFVDTSLSQIRVKFTNTQSMMKQILQFEDVNMDFVEVDMKNKNTFVAFLSAFQKR